ncbi:peptidase, M50 family protein [Flavobacterium sp. MDT1-60]|uniref:peptidase, M50 family protein n=1 Tax=Flavobacterium sp. MDT1-60 TaxID=1979344 RepID=UPI0017800956|nr:peptidase, M50 family protein [Flavobacterium sp. MDT1-60]QOG02388.1 peptidase, M50 family protein [Flavobacterium sp. MDT1-60]
MNINTIPILSNDITFNPINGEDYFIHQETYDHRVKISRDLYDFMQLIDNKKELKNLVSDYNTKFNSFLTNEFAYEFLFNKLAKFGIIEAENVVVKPNLKPGYLKLSFILINEKRASKITQYLKYLFLPKIIKSVSVLALIVLSISFYIFRNEIFYVGIGKAEWGLFFLLSFIGVTFHEFGHAAAAHYFGAKHGGIGGGFYLLMPVYFADVTDIWKLPKKERITVNLAGLYFEMIYAVFLIGAGLVLNYQTLIILACVFLLSTLNNINPFVRSDGYWVLSDAIEKPNMMFHALFKIKELGKPEIKWQKLDYFLLFYGIISYAFLAAFIYYVIIKDPGSILYFPQNVKNLIHNLFSEGVKFSIAELSRLFVPIMFFTLIFQLLKKTVSSFILRRKEVHT